jgi:hypothetical protein
MSTIKVREELLCFMTFTEHCMFIRGNSNTDKELQNFHSNSEGFHAWPMYNSQAEVF